MIGMAVYVLPRAEFNAAVASNITGCFLGVNVALLPLSEAEVILFHSSQVILHDKLYIFAWTFC
jgi:hypothetical protein